MVMDPPSHPLPVTGVRVTINELGNDNAGGCPAISVSIPQVPNVMGSIKIIRRAPKPMLMTIGI